MYTHFSATIQDRSVSYFPWIGRIDDDMNMLELANEGTTPNVVQPWLQAKADEIRAALLAGETYRTKTAIITPMVK